MLSATIRHIIVLCSNRIDVNCPEYCRNCHIAGDLRVFGNLRIGAVDNPLFKDLAGHKGILGQSADRFAFCTEILEYPFIC